jgi:hypothetical protein
MNRDRRKEEQRYRISTYIFKRKKETKQKKKNKHNPSSILLLGQDIQNFSA